MKRSFKTVALALALLLSLCSCGSAQATDPVALFSQQTSFTCTLTYDVDCVISYGDTLQLSVTQHLEAEGAFDVSTGDYSIVGTLNTYQDEDASFSSFDVAIYGIGAEDCAYYQYDNSYFTQEGTGDLAAIILAVGSMDFSALEKQDNTVVWNGSNCDVYTGSDTVSTTLMDALTNSLTDDSTLEANHSAMEVTLQVFQETNLPATVTYAMTDIAEEDMTYSNALGLTYNVSSITYSVTYNTYGAEVDVAPPEGFVDTVLANDQNSSLEDTEEDLEESASDAEETDIEEDLTSEGYVDNSDQYQLTSTDGSYFWLILAPAQMDLYDQEDQSLTFVYNYSDEDSESAIYTLYEDFTFDDEADYAQSLTVLLEADSAHSNVTEEGVQTVTLGGYTVGYNVFYYTYTYQSVAYECVDVYAWIAAPNGKDCLEVEIVEANASGDGMFIDPLEELTYAVDYILGVQ